MIGVDQTKLIDRNSIAALTGWHKKSEMNWNRETIIRGQIEYKRVDPKEIEVNYTGQKQIELGTITLFAYERELTEFLVTVKKRSFFGRFWRKITKPFR